MVGTVTEQAPLAAPAAWGAVFCHSSNHYKIIKILFKTYCIRSSESCNTSWNAVSPSWCLQHSSLLHIKLNYLL